MKRKLAALMVATMVMGTLAGCGSPSNNATTDDSTVQSTDNATENVGNTEKTEEAKTESVTLEFWNSWTGSDGDTLVEKVNEFNETNPYGITINMDISSSFAEKLSTSLPTGEAAPLVLLGAADRFTYQEYLLDINDIWENTSLSEDEFNASAMSAMKIGDDLYSIPFQNSMYYLYWNKDLFEAAGLDPESPPQSYEEWSEMAAQITNEDLNVYGSGLIMSYGNHEMCMMQMLSGRLVTKTDDGKWSVNIEHNTGVKEYLEWMKSVFDSGNNPKDNGVESMFNAGQIGLMLNGPWHAAGAEAAGINFGMQKIFGEEPVGDVAGFFITSSASDAEKLAAERFIEWWYKGNEGSAIEETGAGVWSTELGFPTAYLPLAETDTYINDEKLAALALADDSNESIWIVTDPDFPGWAETIGVVSTLTESVVFDTPIEDAMATAQESCEEIVRNYCGADALAE